MELPLYFYCSIKVRYQLKLRKLLIGNAAQLVQDTVGQLQQLHLVRFQLSAHVCQLLHQTGTGAGIVNAHQI